MEKKLMEYVEKLFEYNEIIKENDDVYRRLAKSFGMSQCTFWILYSLRTAPAPMTQSELCKLLYEPKQTVNSALKKLETEGYLTLTQGSDRRSKVITLTQKGSALAGRSADRVISAEEHAILSLSEAEQNMLISLFRKYTNAFKIQIKEMKET